MARESVNEIANFLNRLLSETGLTINNIALFGSHVGGKEALDSDIDLIIVSDDFQGKDIFERAEMTMHAEVETIRKFMIPMDVLKMTPDEFQLSEDNKRFETELLFV